MNVPDSERLRFRLLDREDADLFYELDQDPEVMKFINGGKPTKREEIESIYLPRLESYLNPEQGWGIWGVFLKEDGRFLGWILVRPMNFFTAERDDSNLELGWRFFQREWGYGFATEAAKHVAESVETDPSVSRVSALAMEGNTASISVMTKLGMKYVKTYLHRDPLGDATCVLYERSCPSPN